MQQVTRNKLNVITVYTGNVSVKTYEGNVMWVLHKAFFVQFPYGSFFLWNRVENKGRVLFLVSIFVQFGARYLVAVILRKYNFT